MLVTNLIAVHNFILALFFFLKVLQLLNNVSYSSNLINYLLNLFILVDFNYCTDITFLYKYIYVYKYVYNLIAMFEKINSQHFSLDLNFTRKMLDHNLPVNIL